MKIYCILCDTMPYTKQVQEFSKSKNMNLMRQVGECYSFASLTSMFTGKLGCDLLEGGIGWETHEEYKSKNVKMKLPWLSQQIPEILRDNGWQIHVHNNTTEYRTLVSNEPGTIFDNRMHCTKEDYIRKQTDEIKEIYEEEKKYIREMQAEKSNQDTFHFICYDHFHFSTAVKLLEDDGCPDAEKRVFELLNCYDFSEPDSMFWVFADHGPWWGLEENPLPKNYLSWTMIKDNIGAPIKVNSNYISIRDFHTTMVDKFGLKNTTSIPDIQSVQKSQDKDRIYYLEDARAATDTKHATTAVACQFINWKCNIPSDLLQVAYYEPTNSFIGTSTSLDKFGIHGESIDLPVCPKLKEALISRIGWIMCDDYKRKERWMKIYSKAKPEVLLHVIIRRENIKGHEKASFCGDNESLHVFSRDIPAGTKYDHHSHTLSNKNEGVCQESWVVIEGVIVCYLYDLDKELLVTSTLRQGDCVISFRGGHGYDGISENALVYEFKSGPFQDGDKKSMVLTPEEREAAEQISKKEREAKLKAEESLKENVE